MTTLAWDGTTLAADKGSFYGDVVIPKHKLHRIKWHGVSAICGVCGDAGVTHQILRWMQGKEFDNPRHDNESMVVAVTKSGLWSISSTLIPIRINSKIFATGSGGTMAMGALAVGASAKAAVKAVEKWGCGACNGVDTMTLEK